MVSLFHNIHKKAGLKKTKEGGYFISQNLLLVPKNDIIKLIYEQK
jgi:hypothetical protein